MNEPKRRKRIIKDLPSKSGWGNTKTRSGDGTPKVKLRPWLRNLNDADQEDFIEYHNPRLSIFYPQEGL